jgi:chromosome segregation ATPase
MTLLTDLEETGEGAVPGMRAKMRMLGQMAEALEDEAAGLYRRAAVYEEDEFLMEREIEERQTEINRLSLKLNALRASRAALLARITSLTDEATALREEVYCDEEARALAAIERAALQTPAGQSDIEATAESAAPRSIYFRRVEPADVSR